MLLQLRNSFFALLAVLVASAAPVAAWAQVGPPQGRYIVVLNPDIGIPEDVAADVALRTNGKVGYIYRYALSGFSITMPRAALAGIARDPRVAYIEEDRPVSINVQDIPTGIERINADLNGNIDIDGIDDFQVDVDVAVLDTGIDFQHPDLNVMGGVNCSGGSPFNNSCSPGGDDDHYHGTHVAGTIGALDNGIGVVGVAPGARLWAVKVLKSNGSGYTSWIVAGIDWVVGEGYIEVINMSLGGSGVSRAYETAIDAAVASGVVVVVAAGNDASDANNYSPAYVDSAITVSALADFDGVGGGSAAPTCRDDQDDTLADFSNWGTAVDIAAPGVCIRSTYPLEKGEYGTISGTSMAAPHVAGAAALLASTGLSPADIRDAFIQMDNSGWTDDSPDEITEPLLDVSTFGATLIATGGGGVVDDPPTASFSVSCDDLTCAFTDTSTDTNGGVILSWLWTFQNSDGSITTSILQNPPDKTYAAAGTYNVSLMVTDDADPAQANTATRSVTVSAGTDPGTGPSLGSIDPPSYNVNDGPEIPVTISGSGFGANATVTFQNGSGPTPIASGIVVVNSGEINLKVSARLKGKTSSVDWDVVVTNSDGLFDVMPGAFTVIR
jgi:subtilisin family serine protease